mmetsp:Transcript_1664/g.1885  ORF Transcript_1664/g.1885 Transcript_1664/m.1885 type:complete len:156 (-) Transcript_1664:3-470(-)
MGGLPGMGGMLAMGGMGGMGCMGGMGGSGNTGDSVGLPAISDAERGGTTRDNGMGGKDNFALGKELVTTVMDDMPSYVTQDPRGFVLRSAVPSRMAGGMQRKSIQVMDKTRTTITFHSESNSSTRMMSIEGPLLNVCASYMLMMRRYLEVEREVC